MNTVTAVSLTGKWKVGDLPFDPQVSIILTETHGEVDGLPRLTASLASDTEIDFAINTLIQHLEGARNLARRMLKEQKQRMQASAGEA